MKQIKKADVVYHYCSMSSLFSILQTKTLRLSNNRCMNDSMELGWIYDVARSNIRNKIRGGENEAHQKLMSILLSPHEGFLLLDKTFLPSVYCGCFSKEGDLLSPHEGFLLLDKTFLPSVYCGCFSKEGDLLSQWRAYAEDGQGVAIGFDRSWLDSLVGKGVEVEVKDVIYSEEHVNGIVSELVDGAIAELGEQPVLDETVYSIANRLESDLYSHAPHVKNPAFQEECEVRLVVMETSAGMKDAGKKPPVGEIDFFCRDGMIVPFRPLSLCVQSNVICEIVLGPRNFSEHNIQALMLLTQTWGGGLARDQFRKSNATYRKGDGSGIEPTYLSTIF